MAWKQNEINYLKQNFPTQCDSELAGVIGKSPNAVRIKASRMGICKKSTLIREDLELNSVEKQVILGGLLGDLSCRITHTSKNARLEGGHCAKQKRYLLWKMDLMNRLMFRVRKSKINTYLYQSKSFKALNEYYSLFYNWGFKVINKDILASLEDLGLLVWYLDDGSYKKRDKSCCLHTNGFSFEENVLIKNWFNNKHDLWPKIYHSKDPKRYPNKIWHYLYFNVRDTQKLFKIFLKFDIPDCMKYKLGLNQITLPSLSEIGEQRSRLISC